MAEQYIIWVNELADALAKAGAKDERPKANADDALPEAGAKGMPREAGADGMPQDSAPILGALDLKDCS